MTRKHGRTDTKLLQYKVCNNIKQNHISDVRVSVLASNGFEPRSCQTKDYEIDICCFSAKLRSTSKDWLAQNQDNVSEWFDKDCFCELAL